MDIKHALCNHASGPVKMKRIYIRQDRRFVPVGWYCPDCKQYVNDAPGLVIR